MTQDSHDTIYLAYLLRKAQPPEQVVIGTRDHFTRVYSLGGDVLVEFRVDDIVVRRQDTKIVVVNKVQGKETVLQSMNAELINSSIMGLGSSDLSYSCLSGDSQVQLAIRLGAFYLVKQGNLVLKQMITGADQVQLDRNVVVLKSLAYTLRLVFLSGVDGHEVFVLLNFNIHMARAQEPQNPKTDEPQLKETLLLTTTPAQKAQTRTAQEVIPRSETHLVQTDEYQSQQSANIRLSQPRSDATTIDSVINHNNEKVVLPTAQPILSSQSNQFAEPISAQAIKAAIKALCKDFDAKIVATGQKIVIAFAFEEGSLLMTVVAKCQVLYHGIKVQGIQIVDQQKRRVVVQIAPIQEQLLIGTEFMMLYKAWITVQFAIERGVNVAYL